MLALLFLLIVLIVGGAFIISMSMDCKTCAYNRMPIPRPPIEKKENITGKRYIVTICEELNGEINETNT